MKVEVVCDPDCPNVPEARTQLLRAFAEVGISPSWIEWNHDSTAAPIYAHAFGSPTVLVNGQDVSQGTPTSGKACCRLYPDASGILRGAPSVEQIVVALKACLLDSPSPPCPMQRQREGLGSKPVTHRRSPGKQLPAQESFFSFNRGASSTVSVQSNSK